MFPPGQPPMKHHDSLLIGRRSFLAAAAAASVAGTAPSPRLRATRPAGPLSRPRHHRPRQALRQVQDRQHPHRAPVHRHALGRGAGLERRRPLPASGATSPTTAAALARRGRPRQRLPQARPTTPTATPSTAKAASSPASTAPAAWSATSTTASVTVLADKFAGQAAQRSQRHRRPSRRRHLVHRPRLRHPDELRGPQGRAGDSRRPSTASIRRRGKMDKVTDEIFKPNGLCFSPDYKKLYICRHRRVALRQGAEEHQGLRRRRRQEARRTAGSSSR